MKESFVFYRSFWKVFSSMPPEDVQTLLNALCSYALDGEDPELPYPMSGFFVQMKANVDAAGKRYDKAVEDGRKGGRPRVWVNRDVAEAKYADLKSWDAVADALGVDRSTLWRVRKAWKAEDVEKLQNLNVNVNDNVNVNGTLSLINKKAGQPAAGPSGPPSASAKKELRPPPLPIPKRGDKGDDGSNTC